MVVTKSRTTAFFTSLVRKRRLSSSLSALMQTIMLGLQWDGISKCFFEVDIDEPTESVSSETLDGLCGPENSSIGGER